MADLNKLIQPFCPFLGVNVSTISVTSGNGASGTSVNLPAVPGSSGGSAIGDPVNFLVYNSGTFPVALAFGFGASAVASVPNGATAGGIVIPGGVAAVLTIPGNPTTVAAWGIGGAVTVYVTPGEGR